MRLFYIPCLLSAALLLGTSASAAENDHFFLNGTAVNCIYSSDSFGNIQLSARKLFESAGYTVQWFPSENRVTAFSADTNITLYAGSQRIYINDESYITTDEMEFVDGTSVIPLSLAASALDADIELAGADIYFNTDKAIDCSGWQYDVLTLVNAEREKYGLDYLVWNSDLASAAYAHCEDMAERDYFSHNTPEGLTPFDRLRDYGIDYIVAAENIAAGQPDPESVVEAWMNSPDHRSNILNDKLKEIGIAFVRGGSYGIYWAQEFAATR